MNIADLAREPEFHLDELLGLLATVPDGYKCQRKEVHDSNPRPEPVWDLDTAHGYGTMVSPAMQCGFTEDGDGKVLTALTSRLAETHGRLTLCTVYRMVTPTTPIHGRCDAYPVTEWSAAVTLGVDMPAFSDSPENPRAGQQAVGQSGHPGVAVLLAYLRAWGVLA